MLLSDGQRYVILSRGHSWTHLSQAVSGNDSFVSLQLLEGSADEVEINARADQGELQQPSFRQLVVPQPRCRGAPKTLRQASRQSTKPLYNVLLALGLTEDVMERQMPLVCKPMNLVPERLTLWFSEESEVEHLTRDPQPGRRVTLEGQILNPLPCLLSVSAGTSDVLRSIFDSDRTAANSAANVRVHGRRRRDCSEICVRCPSPAPPVHDLASLDVVSDSSDRGGSARSCLCL